MKADYAKITQEEKDALCNGVGPQYLDWVCALVPLRKLFEGPANIHDWDYGVGGGLSEYARANLRFYANCLRSVADQSPLWKWPYHLLVSHLYYVLVKLFGGLSFHWGYPRSQEDMHALAVQIHVKYLKDSIYEEHKEKRP